MDDCRHFLTYVHADAGTVWRQLTDGGSQAAWYMPTIDWNLAKGGRVSWGTSAEPAIVGEVTAYQPRHRFLTHTFAFVFVNESPGLVLWRVTQMGEVTQVWLRHELENRPATAGIVGGSWTVMLARLKSLVETGRPMPEPVWPEDGWDADPD